MVPEAGFEPATLRSSAGCSPRLSYSGNARLLNPGFNKPFFFDGVRFLFHPAREYNGAMIAQS